MRYNPSDEQLQLAYETALALEGVSARSQQEQGVTVYIVIKGAKEVTGESMFASVEKAFDAPAKAEEYVRKSGVVWEEQILGRHCHCERVIHTAEVE